MSGATPTKTTKLLLTSGPPTCKTSRWTQPIRIRVTSRPDSSVTLTVTWIMSRFRERTWPSRQIITLGRPCMKWSSTNSTRSRSVSLAICSKRYRKSRRQWTCSSRRVPHWRTVWNRDRPTATNHQPMHWRVTANTWQTLIDLLLSSPSKALTKQSEANRYRKTTDNNNKLK